MAIWIQLVVHKLRLFFLHHCGFLIYCTGPPNRTSEFFLGTGYSASPARSNSKGKCVMVIILKWPLSFWEVFFSNTVGFQIMLPKHLQCILTVPLEVAAQHTTQTVMVSMPGWNEVKPAYIFKEYSFKYDYFNNFVTQDFQIRQLVPTMAMSWELALPHHQIRQLVPTMAMSWELAMPHHQNLTIMASILIL